MCKCAQSCICHYVVLSCKMLAFKTVQPSLLTFLPSVCPRLCTRVPREHWWDSAPRCQPVFLKGIIVLSCCALVNQWDSLFPLQHVGLGARPVQTSRLVPAVDRVRLFFRVFCIVCLRTVTFHPHPGRSKE